MTFREKLKQKHPEKVGDCFIGGCEGCPHDYGFGPEEVGTETCPKRKGKGCGDCWDREIPEPKPTEPLGVVYLSGPITGVPNYWEAFEKVEDQLTSLGWVVLSPAKHPQGLTNEQYMRIDFAMIDVADVVLFLPGSDESKGAVLEHHYCDYTGKPVAYDINELEEVLRK